MHLGIHELLLKGPPFMFDVSNCKRVPFFHSGFLFWYLHSTGIVLAAS